MKATIVGVGDELLAGIVVNTNAARIGRRLLDAGVPVVRSVCVGDVEDEIVEVIASCAALSQTVIITGGLGPTQDDRSRQAIARLLGTTLVRHDDLVEAIRARMARFGRTMPDSNLQQADIPDGATAIPNPVGTAPGIRAAYKDAVLYAIPGVPSEADHLFEESILPDLLARMGEANAVIRTRDLRCVGIAESELAERLADLATAIEPRMAFLPGGGSIRLRYVSVGASAEECEKRLDECERVVRERCGVAIFGTGDQTLEDVVGELLVAKRMTIATAESCTAGLVAARIANVPGASRYLRGGSVSYQSDVKAKQLGISHALIEAAGAVSGEVAMEMARGARLAFEADLGVSVTCAAGPEAVGIAAPGTVYIGLAGPTRASEIVREVRLPGERDLVRQFAVTQALNLVRLYLSGVPLR